MKVRFTCPECNGHQLEEVLGMATVVNTVEEVTTKPVAGIGVMVQFHGTPAIEDGDVVRYACAACGHEVVSEDGEPITDPAELLAWLKARGMVEGDSTS